MIATARSSVLKRANLRSVIASEECRGQSARVPLSQAISMTEAPSCLIAVIVAGTNEPSNSNALADAFIEGVKVVPGVTFEKVQLKELSIAHFTLDCYERDAKDEPDFARIKTLLLDASGVCFASPVWNFSVPGHFKNLLDRMGAFGLDSETRRIGKLKGKPFALMFTGGTPYIAWQALMYQTTLHVIEAIKFFGGVTVQKSFEPRCMLGKGKFGYVMDQRPESLAKARTNGEKFARLALGYAQTGTIKGHSAIIQKTAEFLYRVVGRIQYELWKLQ